MQIGYMIEILFGCLFFLYLFSFLILYRKFKYAINAQVIGGPDGIIYDCNVGSPGVFSDSTTWRCSGKPFSFTL